MLKNKYSFTESCKMMFLNLFLERVSFWKIAKFHFFSFFLKKRQTILIFVLYLIIAISILLYLSTFPYNPINSKLPNFIEENLNNYFKLKSISNVENELTIIISYQNLFDFLPQYILPYISVELNSFIGKFTFYYRNFQNQEVHEKTQQISFQIYPHVAGKNFIKVKLNNQTIGTSKLNLNVPVLYKSSSTISTHERYTFLQNICINNDTILFSSFLDFEPDPNARLFNKIIKKNPSSLKNFINESHPKLIKNNSYYIKSSSAIEFIYSIINLPLDNKDMIIFIPKDIDYIPSLLSKLQINSTNYIEEPICFKSISFSNPIIFSTNDVIKLNSLTFNKKEVDQTKIIADSNIANKITNSIPLSLNASLDEAYNLLHDAKVYVGSSKDSTLLTYLMSDDETAFFDLSKNSFSKENEKLVKKPKYFHLSSIYNNYETESIDWNHLNSLINSIITNSEDSPLL